MGCLNRSSKNKSRGTYAKQFERTVTRTGKWRGRTAKLSDLGTHNCTPNKGR